MRLPATWTQVMAVTIGCYATFLCATIFGGGWLAWALALPAMFFGLQLLGLPIVMFCELAERIRLLPRSWRPMVDEIVIVACLIAFGFWLLTPSVATSMGVFFGVMYSLRLLSAKLWRPGEAEEVDA